MILYLIPKVVQIAIAKGLVDKPNGRTVHQGNIPNLGGLALLTSIVVTSLLFWNMSLIDKVQYRLVGIIIIFLVGFKDDILVISHRKKFYGEIIASLVVIILGDVRLTNLHGFLGVTNIPYLFSIGLSLFVFILIINSFNLIDGIDGLSAGIGIVISLTFGIWFYLVGKYELVIIAAAMIGSLISFFYFNVYGTKNKIFMGDSGALLIGFLIAIFAIRFNELNLNNAAPYYINNAPIVSIGILAIPLFDTARVMFLRFLRKQSPFKPDRRHMHHMLLDLKLTHFQATATLVIASVFIIVTMLLLQQIIQNILILGGILLVLVLGLSYIPYAMLNQRKKETKDYGFRYYSLD